MCCVFLLNKTVKCIFFILIYYRYIFCITFFLKQIFMQALFHIQFKLYARTGSLIFFWKGLLNYVMYQLKSLTFTNTF